MPKHSLLVLVFLFLAMDPVWTSVSVMENAAADDPALTSDIFVSQQTPVLISTDTPPTPSSRYAWLTNLVNTEELKTQFSTVAEKIKNQFSRKKIGKLLLGAVSESEWKSFEKMWTDENYGNQHGYQNYTISDDSKINSVDMMALTVLFGIGVFVAMAGGLAHIHYPNLHPSQIITVCVLGYSIMIIASMYLFALARGQLAEDHFHFSFLLAQSPGHLMGVVLAISYLLLPMVELLRPHHNETLRRVRFWIALIFATAVACVAFFPERLSSESFEERIPHLAIAFLVVALSVIQTVLIYSSLYLEWWKVVLIAFLIIFLALGVPAIIIFGAKIKPNSRGGMIMIGSLEIGLYLIIHILWIAAVYVQSPSGTPEYRALYPSNSKPKSLARPTVAATGAAKTASDSAAKSGTKPPTGKAAATGSLPTRASLKKTKAQ